MIETLYGSGTLDSPKAFVLSLLIGFLFGVVLEKAGFGSSRRLAGIFYFKDMAVLKVMFSALITAMLGLSYLLGFGWLAPDQLYFMPTVYGAYIVGGLLFGIGFVMGGWCPGTAVVGLASGKIDALVFLLGSVIGTILFNELFGLIKPLYSWGDSGVRFIHESIGVSRGGFALVFTVIAVICFWGAEYIERKKTGSGYLFNSPFLKSYSLALVTLAGGLLILPVSAGMSTGNEGMSVTAGASGSGAAEIEAMLLKTVESGGDHMEPRELAERLMRGGPGLVLVDIRTPEEFKSFHIRGAVNVVASELDAYLKPYKNTGTIVLYSNGMTHPAQLRDSLFRKGYGNVFILTDGLKGFIETNLKPASLRMDPLPKEWASEIHARRAYFYASAEGSPSTLAAGKEEAAESLRGLVETEWLAANLGREDVKIIDVRTQPEYNTSHIPGAVFLSYESLRGVVNGIPSMLLPAEALADHMSRMGIRPTDRVVIVPGDRPLDATLVGMAFERLGHRQYGVLHGGFGKWISENRPVNAALPAISVSQYPVKSGADGFTVDYKRVLQAVKNKDAVILDVRPFEFYEGKKSDEARAGHIPGAINRTFSEDTVKLEKYVQFKPIAELEAAYASLIPSKDTTVIVHCRTGHQASQTFFVLKHLLGYRNVFYYDAGWTEWSARPELPIETGKP